MQKTVFIDRDGVICENRADYVKDWSEFTFLPNALEALAGLKQAGYRIFIVTNQSAIGRGLMGVETLQDIHTRMLNAIEQAGGEIEHVFYCPHRPDEACRCRKPQPGLLKQAADLFHLDLKDAYMIGDAYSDIQAGQAVGCTSFLVLTGRGLAQLPLALRNATTNFHVVPHLDVAVKHIISNGCSRAENAAAPVSYAQFVLPQSAPIEP